MFENTPSVVQARMTWPQVCALSRDLTNGLEGAREDLAYMATDSMGGREVELADGSFPWHRANERDVIGDDPFGEWVGWAEDQVASLVWTSATSGARLHVWPNEGYWACEYTGPTGLSGFRQSQYLGIMLRHSSEPMIVEEGSLGLTEGDLTVRV